MTHPTREEWMAYLYGELDTQKETTLKSHLQECPQCEHEVAAWRGAMAALDMWQLPGNHKSAFRLRQVTRRAVRWAAAAALLIAAGYVAGRVSAPRPLDREQLFVSLKSSLEPAIRLSLAEQTKRDMGLALASNNARFSKELAQFKEKLNAQHRRDLNEFAAKTLVISGAATDQRLRELIISIDSTQRQDRYRFAAALSQIESNRLQDKTRLRHSMAGLAALTATELHRTKQGLTQLLSAAQRDQPDPGEFEYGEPPNERREK